MASFPTYLLDLDDGIKIVFPENRLDIGHTDYWEQTVSHIIAQQYGIPQKMLANLPYSQRRARIVGNALFYGEKDGAAVLPLVRQAVGNEELLLSFDEHERRLREDVRAFRRLLHKRATKS